MKKAPDGAAALRLLHLLFFIVSIDSAAIRRRNRRVDRYRQLVRPIALHYARRCAEPLDDLIQVGLMGLLRAAELYSEASATPFSAFARPHIRGAMLHYLRDTARPIRLPRRISELLDLRRRCLKTIPATTEGVQIDERLRLAMGLTPDQWDSLEQARQLNNLAELTDLADQSLIAGQSDGADSNGLEETVLDALQQLEPLLAEVVRGVVLRGWSYRRAASHLAVSPMTVQRRLHRGLALLREQLIVSLPASGYPVPSAAPGC